MPTLYTPDHDIDSSAQEFAGVVFWMPSMLGWTEVIGPARSRWNAHCEPLRTIEEPEVDVFQTVRRIDEVQPTTLRQTTREQPPFQVTPAFGQITVCLRYQAVHAMQSCCRQRVKRPLRRFV